MLTNVRGIKALQQLRIDLQESAGLEFPHAYTQQLLILHDVCKYLEIPVFQAREILGVHGYNHVAECINSSVDITPKGRSHILNQLQA